MKYILVFSLLLFFDGSLSAQRKMETVFEQSNGTVTGTYQEVINYYTGISHVSPYLQIREMGLTDSGLPLHLVLMDTEGKFDLETAREGGKTILLINNGIHPGEPDGIEATQLLLRDFITDKQKRNLLKNVIIAVIPVYNVGGALNRNEFSRANQNGPSAYGFRGNARNFDLNRDFIKADTKNTKSFYEIFHLVQPDIFIDTHVSNGADYQYSITHLATQHNKIDGKMGKYLHEEFTPGLEKLMKKKGSEITPYVNVFNATPDSGGITQFMDYPRYSTGYTALFNTLGFMIETHMLKPFDVRVQSTYDFLESIVELAIEDGEKIRKLHRSSVLKPGDLHPIDWQLDTTQSEVIDFKGYEGEMTESRITGKQRLSYDRDQPFTKKISYYSTYKASAEVPVPRAYLIPQGWYKVIDRLKLNDLQFTRLEKDTVINLEAYKIENFKTALEAYEGHYPHRNIKVSKSKRLIQFRKGDYVFYTDQVGGRFLVETLEPEAADSYFKWNFFDTILQQKEHFSPYVFEEVAWKLLQEDRNLKMAFEEKKEVDAEFADDWYAQLEFIYKHSPYYETAHLNYPVYRLVEGEESIPSSDK